MLLRRSVVSEAGAGRSQPTCEAARRCTGLSGTRLGRDVGRVARLVQTLPIIVVRRGVAGQRGD